MNKEKVFYWLDANERYLFPNGKYSKIDVGNVLISAPEQYESELSSITLCSPTKSLLLSLIGLDRFYHGDSIIYACMGLLLQIPLIVGIPFALAAILHNVLGKILAPIIDSETLFASCSICGMWAMCIINSILARRRCRRSNCKKIIKAFGSEDGFKKRKNADAKIEATKQAAKIMAPKLRNVGRALKDLSNSLDIPK